MLIHLKMCLTRMYVSSGQPNVQKIISFKDKIEFFEMCRKAYELYSNVARARLEKFKVQMNYFIHIQLFLR